MVSYCCVNGCGNNSKNKNKNPNPVVSFHVFPANKELRSKWLRAIGRPNWSPSNHARICSAHFVYDQINHDGCKIRIKDYAIPVLLLPLNSNFDASKVEACRICLATDLKLFSLQDTHLEICMKSIAGLSLNGMDLEDMPQYVCYQCEPSLIRCKQLIEKCITSQATLLDIFAKNGQISKDLIREQNRSEPILRSLENSSKLNDYLHKYDEDYDTSLFTTEDSIDNDHRYFKSEDDTNTDADTYLNDKACQVEANETEFFEVNDVVVEKSIINSSDNVIANGDLSKNLSSNSQKEEEYDQQVIHTKTKPTKKSLKLTPDETSMQKYFNIVELSLHEQVKEWEKSTVGSHLTNETNLQCEICNKSFASVNSYRGHVTHHELSFGRVQCRICKLQFKSSALVTSHTKRAHSKKFYCKMCPKAFNNVMVAKKHQRWHAGYLYKCDSCPFATLHESSLSIHKRRAHANVHACALCGRAYSTRRGLDAHIHIAHSSIKVKDIKVSKEFRCEQCGIDFASEGAKRMHILTSFQHRKKHDLCYTAVEDPNLPNICEKCGIECATARELSWHKKSEHPRPRSKNHLTRGYPKDCELVKDIKVSKEFRCEQCGIDFASEGAKRMHILTSFQHRKKHDLCYTAVEDPNLSNICEKCGIECATARELSWHKKSEHPRPRSKNHLTRGYPKDCELNSTKLRLHQLRHRSPAVRCPSCPRLFYDQHALAAHAPTHAAARPHRCRTCGAAFKQRCNLDRHYRVHSDIATFECTICGKKFKYSTSLKLHVNCVHNKLPYPKRKKRIKSVKNASDS